jgi:alkylhydroperoxidase family enzyme
MRTDSPRIPQVPREAYTQEQAALAKGRDMFNFTQVMLQHPTLYEAYIPFAEKLMRGSGLPPRDREIIVLRTLALCNEAYDLSHHVLMARGAGLTDAEIEAARTGGTGLSEFERMLAKAAEDLVGDHRVGDEAWQALAKRYSRPQLMEVVCLVGDYSLMAMITKSFGIPIEDNLETILHSFS